MRRLHRFYHALTSRRLALSATILAVIAIFYVINSPVIVGASATKRELPIYSVRRDNKAVSLTFDTAGSYGDTQALIDILGKYRIKATFFADGVWVDAHPSSVLALSGAGHEVMNRSDDNAHFPRLPAAQIIRNVSACNSKIAAITGIVPTLFRCPYGEYDDHVVKTLTGMGMQTIQWDVDSQDWKELSADQIVRRVTGKVEPGSIVLFHSAAPHTRQALPAIIEYLIRNGYTIVPVSQLTLKGTFVIDRTGRQIPG